MTIELNSRSFGWGNSVGQVSRLGAALLAERHRWPLWLPVALGTGTALYFASPFEPAPLIAGAMALMCLAAGLGAYRSHDPWARAALALIAAVALGFGNAKGRELRMAAPVVPHPIVTHLTGRVVALDWGRAGLRAVLDDVRSGRLPDPPSRVRALVRKGGEALGIGQGVDLTALLMPPPGPAAPGDDDFARAAYFAGIGAVGFAFGAPGVAPLPHAQTFWERISGLVETMRAAMTARIRAQPPDSEGAIASAIITGERGASIPMTKPPCAMPAWRMCWRSPGCIWRWWARACSGWPARFWRSFPRSHSPIRSRNGPPVWRLQARAFIFLSAAARLHRCAPS